MGWTTSSLRPCAYWAIDTHLNFARSLRRAQGFGFVFAAQKQGATQLQQALEKRPANQGDGRFTPTRVGTTCPSDARASVCPVHPHACGDNIFDPLLKVAFGGSPPRVWGQLLWSETPDG